MVWLTAPSAVTTRNGRGRVDFCTLLEAEWLEREGGRTVFIRHVGYSVGSDCLFRRYTGPYKTVITDAFDQLVEWTPKHDVPS